MPSTHITAERGRSVPIDHVFEEPEATEWQSE